MLSSISFDVQLNSILNDTLVEKQSIVESRLKLFLVTKGKYILNIILNYQVNKGKVLKASKNIIVIYSAILLYLYTLGRHFYVDIRKCRYIDIMEKYEINKK